MRQKQEDPMSEAAPAASQRDALLGFLDEFRAAEALGEASLGAWIAVSGDAFVRGGLRTIQRREGMHARLLEARLNELGGSPSHEIPETRRRAVMQGAGSAEIDDAVKLKGFVAQFPDIDAALKPILDCADGLADDPETQALLRTIAQDERSTLEFLREACARLNPKAGGAGR
jgi:hypothetical protein